MTSSYPRLEKTSDSRIAPARICTDFPSLPLPPNVLANPPALPSPTRDPDFADGYTLTTHIIPAAYPRIPSSKWTVLNDAPPDIAPRNEREAWATERAAQLLKKRSDLKLAQVDEEKGSPKDSNGDSDSGSVLWSVVNRYARTKPPKDSRDFGLTVIACHANGLHKEVGSVCSSIPFSSLCSSHLQMLP